MKKSLKISSIFLFDLMIVVLIGIGTSSFTFFPKEKGTNINWMTFEEAIAANKKNKKKIFIDIYTGWCGWCKHMDNTTFKDKKVIEKMNANYYAVKLDAEQKDTINYRGRKFKWVAVKGSRNGIHELAYSLLNGKMSYPQFVILNEDEKRTGIISGYQKPPQLISYLDQ